MKINILAIGKLKNYLINGIEEYLKRLKPFTAVEIVELPEQRTIELEGEILLKRCPKDSWICVLDVGGVELTSEQLAEKIAKLALDGRSNLTFIIGGAFGISQQVRVAADFRLSLSKMTFTHQIARLILIEQIYRAFKINRNEPYHW